MDYRKKLVYQSNSWYNDGLQKAGMHDLSGAIVSLKKSLKYNSKNIAARNLLGLVYYGRGEVAEALVEWIISKNLKAHKNIAEYFIDKVQESPEELETLNQAVKKYNQSLAFCQRGDEDMALIQLKKAVQEHPGYVKAHQLLGLLYMDSGQDTLARQEFKKVYQIDSTDKLTLRYMHELQMAHKKKVAKLKADQEKTSLYKLGNEAIIKPVAKFVKDMSPAATVMNMIIGIIVGAAVVWYLVVPAVESTKSASRNKVSVEYSEEIAAQKAQVSALKKELETYRANSDTAAQQQQQAAATQTAYEALLDINDKYLQGNSKYAELAESLQAVNKSSLGVSGAAAYDKIANEVFPYVCGQLYKEAKTSYRSGDYASASAKLEQIIAMDEDYEDGYALLALADSYTLSGTADKAQATYNRVLELLPGTNAAALASAGLGGSTSDVLGTASLSRSANSSTNSSSSTSDDEDNAANSRTDDYDEDQTNDNNYQSEDEE